MRGKPPMTDGRGLQSRPAPASTKAREREKARERVPQKASFLGRKVEGRVPLQGRGAAAKEELPRPEIIARSRAT